MRARSRARGMVALARCHGRVKISKSTGFAADDEKRCGGASAARTRERRQRGGTMTAHTLRTTPGVRAARGLAAGEISRRAARR